MELKDFIKHTILDVENALFEAKDALKHIRISAKQWGDGKTHNGKQQYDIRELNFDIAITSAESSELGGKAGIRVLGVDGKSTKENSNQSRISFSVPLGIPSQE